MDYGPPQHPGVEGVVLDGLRPLPLDCVNPLLRSCLFSVLVILVLLWTLHLLAPILWHCPLSTFVFSVAPLLLIFCMLGLLDVCPSLGFALCWSLMSAAGKDWPIEGDFGKALYEKEAVTSHRALHALLRAGVLVKSEGECWIS